MGPEKCEADNLTGPEMEVVTVVFHQFETGLREGTIYTRDILSAMKALGLNPAEQEVIDMTNEVANNGLVYFPDFCRIVLRKFREENQEAFNQQLFKVLCGTDPYPQNFRAKRYKIQEKSFSKAEFCNVMRQLPVQVDEEDIEGMFTCADKDKDGRISYSEFLLMIDPPKTGPPPPKACLRPLEKNIPNSKNGKGKVVKAQVSTDKLDTSLAVVGEEMAKLSTAEKAKDSAVVNGTAV